MAKAITFESKHGPVTKSAKRNPATTFSCMARNLGQLYFNMRGYVGTLPTPSGTQLCIGERTITAYRKTVAQLNKEWADSTG